MEKEGKWMDEGHVETAAVIVALTITALLFYGLLMP